MHFVKKSPRQDWQNQGREKGSVWKETGFVYVPRGGSAEPSLPVLYDLPRYKKTTQTGSRCYKEVGLTLPDWLGLTSKQQKCDFLPFRLAQKPLCCQSRGQTQTFQRPADNTNLTGRLAGSPPVPGETGSEPYNARGGQGSPGRPLRGRHTGSRPDVIDGAHLITQHPGWGGREGGGVQTH